MARAFQQNAFQSNAFQTTAVVVSITGHTVDPSGAPLPGSTVLLSYQGTAIATAISDGNGLFNFYGLDPVSYKLEAYFLGVENFTGAVTTPVLRSGVNTVNVVLTVVSPGLPAEEQGGAVAPWKPRPRVAAKVPGQQFDVAAIVVTAGEIVASAQVGGAKFSVINVRDGVAKGHDFFATLIRHGTVDGQTLDVSFVLAKELRVRGSAEASGLNTIIRMALIPGSVGVDVSVPGAVIKLQLNDKAKLLIAQDNAFLLAA